MGRAAEYKVFPEQETPAADYLEITVGRDRNMFLHGASGGGKTTMLTCGYAYMLQRNRRPITDWRFSDKTRIPVWRSTAKEFYDAHVAWITRNKDSDNSDLRLLLVSVERIRRQAEEYASLWPENTFRPCLVLDEIDNMARTENAANYLLGLVNVFTKWTARLLPRRTRPTTRCVATGRTTPTSVRRSCVASPKTAAWLFTSPISLRVIA